MLYGQVTGILLYGQDNGILPYRQDTGILLYGQDSGMLLYCYTVYGQLKSSFLLIIISVLPSTFIHIFSKYKPKNIVSKLGDKYLLSLAALLL